VKNGENCGENWRKIFLEKKVVKNGENYMVDTNSARPLGPARGATRQPAGRPSEL